MDITVLDAATKKTKTGRRNTLMCCIFYAATERFDGLSRKLFRISGPFNDSIYDGLRMKSSFSDK